MIIFKQENKSLKPIHELKIDLEKDIQSLTEENLETIFGLKFVTSEFQLNNLRIDTLAFDEETNSFVIIEYKRDRSFSVIDQGFAYLSLLLNQKADFILKYINTNGNTLDQNSIDWSQSRVIFVANSYTKYQQQAINFQDLPIELWEVKKFSNSTIIFNQLQAPQSSESINKISKNQTITSVSSEVKKYTVNDHFNEGWEESRELFETLTEKILDLDSRIKVNPTKNYIGYVIDKKTVVLVKTRKSGLRLELLRVRPEDIKDPDKKTKYVDKSFERFHKYISFINLNSKNDLDYAMYLTKQVYEKLN